MTQTLEAHEVASPSRGAIATVRRRGHNLRWKVRHWLTWERPHRRILPAVLGDEGYVVRSGPFAGMRYIEDVPLDQALVSRLLGAYEAELHYPVNQMIERSYDVVIDIGSSEGYYAVGFALRSPESRIHAFDIDEDMQAWCRRMAELNGVADRVVVGGRCDPETIQRLADGRTLVISDCEGGEVDVLDPEAAPALRRCDLLVEIHDLFVPGASATIRDRFAATHDIYVIDSMMQDPRRFECLDTLSDSDQHLALDERRPASMQWFVLWAKSLHD